MASNDLVYHTIGYKTKYFDFSLPMFINIVENDLLNKLLNVTVFAVGASVMCGK